MSMMGATVSTGSGLSTVEQLRSSVLQGKPLDASDVKSLEEARAEIRRLRELANRAFDHERKAASNNGKQKRVAVMERASYGDFVKKLVPKSEEVKSLIYNAIKPNILFRNCSENEILDIIDVFDSVEFGSGCTVIKQGDEGEYFYVVESGTLDIRVHVGGKDSNEVHVGVPYIAGSAFGELALMYGSPRAATIRTKEDCKLWRIDRRAFRCITGQHKLEESKRHFDFFRNVKVGDKILGDVLKDSDINAMAMASQKDHFKRGDVIVREGECGDIFYLIESGTVDVYKRSSGVDPIATLTSGQFFGERALLSEDVRQATCIASSDVQCLYLMRDDFVLMLGDLQDLLDGNAKEEFSNMDISPAPSARRVHGCDVKDLTIESTLGVGAFGRVKMVKSNHPLNEFGVQDKDKTDSKRPQRYALKMLLKNTIVENGLQDHVMNEKNVMEELNHPFILKLHCAMQDNKYIYFLLELLLGGELFKYLRAETQFPESWTRFYTSSVLLAFSQIHAKKIAYRDLKPENLVLDAKGYVKIVDFGLAKKLVVGKTWTLCGTPDYLAPEVILNEGHDWAVDYWALGVLIYEMVAGSPPFYAVEPMETYEKILSGQVSIPFHFSRSLADLLKKLLKKYQSKRLGRTKGGTSTVMKHKWFSGFDWEALKAKTHRVPIKPKVSHDADTSNFERYPADEEDAPCCDWSPDI